MCGSSSHRFIYLCLCAVLITECCLGLDGTQVKLPSSLFTREEGEEMEEGSCQQSKWGVRCHSPILLLLFLTAICSAPFSSLDIFLPLPEFIEIPLSKYHSDLGTDINENYICISSRKYKCLRQQKHNVFDKVIQKRKRKLANGMQRDQVLAGISI